MSDIDWRQALNPNITIDINDGWRALVESFYQFRQKKQYECIDIVQIKEKFGDLRIYLQHNDDICEAGDLSCKDACYDFIDAMALVASNTCERCGMYGRLRTDRYWILTLCDTCNDNDTKQTTNIGDNNE